MKLKRLEDLLGGRVARAGGAVDGFDRGWRLIAGDAKRMIAISNDLFAQMTDHAFEGEVLFGVPHDIVNLVIPITLR